MVLAELAVNNVDWIAILVWPCKKSRYFLVPLNCLETSFSAPLGKKKHRFYFLYHICRLIVHCFFPPRDKIMIPVIGQQAVWKPILERSSHEDALKFVEYGNFLGILRWGFRTNSAIINIYINCYILYFSWYDLNKKREVLDPQATMYYICLSYNWIGLY